MSTSKILEFLNDTYWKENKFMAKFKTDKVTLLKLLRNLVSEGIDNAKVNVELESEVAELISDLTDKRRVRRLKSLRRDVDKWIDELKDSKKKDDYVDTSSDKS